MTLWVEGSGSSLDVHSSPPFTPPPTPPPQPSPPPRLTRHRLRHPGRRHLHSLPCCVQRQDEHDSAPLQGQPLRQAGESDACGPCVQHGVRVCHCLAVMASPVALLPLPTRRPSPHVCDQATEGVQGARAEPGDAATRAPFLQVSVELGGLVHITAISASSSLRPQSLTTR